jgi:hypothetical protein
MMHAKRAGNMASSARSAVVSIAECTMFAGAGVALFVCASAVPAQGAGSLWKGCQGQSDSTNGITLTL